MPNIDFDFHKIFVEGQTDQGLIQFILEHKFGITFQNDSAINNAIIDCKGWTNLKEKLGLFDNPERETNGVNIIIFDADSKDNHGGIEKRRKQIIELTKNIKVKSVIFLFPDNESDGDLEDFYCSCFKDDYAFFNQCWDSMVSCFKTNGAVLKLKPIKAAEKVFSYVDLFKAYKEEEYKNSKSKRSYFDKGLWNFDFENNPMLIKLLTFLTDSLKVE
jgi:hypothetical protein